MFRSSFHSHKRMQKSFLQCVSREVHSVWQVGMEKSVNSKTRQLSDSCRKQTKLFPSSSSMKIFEVCLFSFFFKVWDFVSNLVGSFAFYVSLPKTAQCDRKISPWWLSLSLSLTHTRTHPQTHSVSIFGYEKNGIFDLISKWYFYVFTSTTTTTST